MPHAVRVGVVLVDGRLWSSGTRDRVRTRHLQRDPRATLFVFDQAFAALTLETRVRILDGPEVPADSVRLFREMQRNLQPHPAGQNLLWYGKEVTPDEFEAAMRSEGRRIAVVNDAADPPALTRSHLDRDELVALNTALPRAVSAIRIACVTSTTPSRTS